MESIELDRLAISTRVRIVFNDRPDLVAVGSRRVAITAGRLAGGLGRLPRAHRLTRIGALTGTRAGLRVRIGGTRRNGALRVTRVRVRTGNGSH